MTGTMRDKDTISKGPKKRDPACLRVEHDIIIPAGTILRQDPGLSGAFTASVGGGTFSVNQDGAAKHPDTYKRVIA